MTVSITLSSSTKFTISATLADTSNKFTSLYVYKVEGYDKIYVDLSSKLAKTSNTESITISASDLNTDYITEVYIFKFVSDETSSNTSEYICGNTLTFYEATASKALNMKIDNCEEVEEARCMCCKSEKADLMCTLLIGLKLSITLQDIYKSIQLLKELWYLCSDYETRDESIENVLLIPINVVSNTQVFNGVISN